MKRSAALVLLAACGASHPSTSPSATSFPAEKAVEAPAAASLATTPDGGASKGDAPDIDVSTTTGVGLYFAALCNRAAHADDAWLDLHLSAKIRSSVAVRRARDDVDLVALGHEPAPARKILLATDGTGASFCTTSFGAVKGFEASSYYATGILHGKADAYRFVIDFANGHPQLAELAWELPRHPLPKAAKKAPFAIEGSMLDPSAEKAAVEELTTLVEALRAAPQCLYEEGARASSSPIVVVDATKTEGTAVTVRVYPTASPVSASLSACLVTQLTVIANEKLKAPRFAIEGVLHVFLDPKTMPATSFSFSGTKP